MRQDFQDALIKFYSTPNSLHQMTVLDFLIIFSVTEFAYNSCDPIHFGCQKQSIQSHKNLYVGCQMEPECRQEFEQSAQAIPTIELQISKSAPSAFHLQVALFIYPFLIPYPERTQPDELRWSIDK